ncbi:MAG TPA: VOC family protein [Microvirga sp.]|jgi:catechol 2,3-dioxygenase
MTATASPLRNAAGVTSGGAPLRIGAVALIARDLDGMSRFYREVMGLALVDREPGRHRLGVGGTVLLDIAHDPGAQPLDPRSAGLFHTAFLVPSRTDLAQWLTWVADRGVRLQGASDHRVSEAIYLADPEGNGIEIYRDRPSEEWGWRDGQVQMATLRLDLRDLAAAAPARAWAGLAEGSIIGHVHLQVGDLDAAERFYAGRLGLDVVCRYPGATFLSSGGYHHHIGTNIWNSAGAPARPERAAGLGWVELVPADRAVWADLAQHLGAEAANPDGGLALRDPWGTTIRIREP